MTTRANNINPIILTWAREQAGFSLEDAARAIGITDSKKASAIEKLEAMEEGASFPTRPQLLKMANAYRRPLTTFYLNSPPIVSERGEDFRRLSRQLDRREAGLLDALLRDVRARQDMVRAILEDDEDAEKLAFIGSVGIDAGIVETAKRIRHFLNLEEQINAGDAGALFDELRERIEEQGVFVLLIGNLGSHHTNISETVFRGFAIADAIAPFIVINDQDAKPARTFTLIHELIHLFVGATGISGMPTTERPRSQHERVERFCNDVASEFLLPESALDHFGPLDELEAANEIFPVIAARHYVSEYLVAYRFHRAGKIDSDMFQALVAQYAARWRTQKTKDRADNREKEGGPSYYTVRRHRLGRALVEFVGRTLRGGELTHSKAARVLGTKLSSVEPLLSTVKTVNGSYVPGKGL